MEYKCNADIATDVSGFLARYFLELGKYKSRDIGSFHTEDSVYDAGAVRLEGREEITSFSQKRATETNSVARHMLNNLSFDFSDWDAEKLVRITGLMSFYGGIGDGLLPLHLPLCIYDMEFEVVQGGKYGWLMKSTIYEPVFGRPGDDDFKEYMGQK